MEINVNTESFNTASNSLKSKISILQSACVIINAKINAAHDEFDTVNYDKISSALAKILESLNNVNDKLNDTNVYIGKLAEILEKYEGLKY